jgi:hypothetical protein
LTLEKLRLIHFSRNCPYKNKINCLQGALANLIPVGKNSISTQPILKPNKSTPKSSATMMAYFQWTRRAVYWVGGR